MFHSRSTDAETSRLECICSNAAAVGTPLIVMLTIKAIPIMIAFFVLEPMLLDMIAYSLPHSVTDSVGSPWPK